MSKFLIVFHAIFSIVVLLALLGNIYHCRKKLSPKGHINEIFHINIMNNAKENDNFRNVLATASHGQVVLMNLIPGESIGMESHDVDQVFVFVEGNGKASVNNKEYVIAPGDLFLVPAHTVHNITNTGTAAMKLFTIYAPPQHKQGLIQKFKPAKD